MKQFHQRFCGSNLSAIRLMLLFFFSALWLTAPEGSAEAPRPVKVDKEKEEEEQRIKITGWKFINIFKENAVDMRAPELKPDAGHGDGHGKVDEGNIEDAKKVIAEQVKKFDADPDLKHVGELFEKHPFEVVEAIAKAKSLDGDTSMKLAEARRSMINEAMSSALQKVDPGKLLSIGMLDSGNKNSGIASDVDQTLFLTPRGELDKILKAKGISESKMINDVIKAFDAEFKAKYGCTPARLGIECMNGADFFPDWRAQQSSASYELEVDRVVKEKRLNPEAYRSEGQLKSQAEGRGYAALAEHSMRVVALDTIRSQLDEFKKAGRSDADIKAEETRLVKQYLQDFDGLKPKGNSMAALADELKRVAPWTEVEWDRSTDPPKPKIEHLVDTRNKVLKLEPEFQKRFAFDGAWDNWLMFEHHPPNRKKYLLRSVAEGISLLRRIPKGGKLSTFEYEKEFLKNHQKGTLGDLDKFINDVYRPLDKGPDAKLRPERLNRIRKVMAVAAMDRLRHKGDKPFGSYDDAKIYADYMPELTDADRRNYEDNPKSLEGLQKMRLEAAKRAWELEARAMMIENLLRTVQAPAELMNGALSDEEYTKMKKEYSGASKGKLNVAVEKSLFHGLHDLMTVKYAQTLLEPKKYKLSAQELYGDPAHRLLEEIKKVNPEVAERVQQIARDAAFARLCTEPDAKLREGRKGRFRNNAFYEFVHERMTSRFESGKKAYKQVVEDYKKGKYTKEYVTNRLMRMSADRAISSATEVGRALGFNITSVHQYWPVMGQKKLPLFYVEFDGKQAFSSKKLFNNLVTHKGNYDSALQVMLAYQQGGAKQAGWIAAREVILNVPGAAQANAVYELFAHGRPQGAVMMGSAMFVPVLGQAYLVVSIATTSVTIFGNYVLQPLKDDLADLAYQGFLSKQEAGLFQPGRKTDFESKRVSILHFVKIRVIPESFKRPDGKEGMSFHLARFSKDTAFDLEFIESTVNDDYNHLVREDNLGGGKEWEEWLAKTKKDYKLRFEAKRMSLFYHYEKAARAYLKKHAPDVELYQSEDSFPHITKLFRQTVANWINANGEFAAFDENVILYNRFTKEIRLKLAMRMAQDFFQGMEILREGKKSIEKGVRLACEQALKDRTTGEAQSMVVAVDDARRRPGDPRMLGAMRQRLVARKDEARESAPRYHVRPRVLSEKIGANEYKEKLDFLVSVIADPKEFVPPYKLQIEREIVNENLPSLGMWGDVLYVTATATDSTGKPVLLKGQKPWRKRIGVVSKQLLPSKPTLKISRGRTSNEPDGVEVTHPKVPGAKSFEVLRAHKPDGPWVSVAVDSSLNQYKDSFPTAFEGTHEWHYASVPKNRHQSGESLESPDTSKSTSISVSLDLSPPRLKAEVMTRDAYRISIESADERKRRFDRERERAANRKAYEEEVRKAREPDEFKKWLASEKEERKKRKEVEDLNKSRVVVISWPSPELKGHLKGSEKVFLQLFRSERVGGPFRFIQDLDVKKNGGNDPVRGYSIDRHADVLPGLTYIYRARFVARTGGGSIGSDWTDVQVTFPGWRSASHDSLLKSMPGASGTYVVAKGQKIRIDCVKATYKVSISEFKKYSQPHGPAGMNEGTFQSYCANQKRKMVEEFWKQNKSKLERKKATRGELQKELDEKLEEGKKRWFANIKSKAPLASAKLNAVIGRFRPMEISDARNELYSTDERMTKEEYTSKDVYFLIGKGTAFTAPDYGRVFICTNWPELSGQVEKSDERLTIFRYLATATQNRTAPDVGTPKWTCKKNGKYLENHWNMEVDAGWRPVEGETFEFLSAPSLDGPWFSHLGRRHEPHRKAPVMFNRYEVRMGQRAFLRTRIRYAPKGRYMGEHWSQPVEIYRKPEGMSLYGDIGPSIPIFGKKGQKLSVTVTGTWDPVRFEGLGTYGPEGISESVFRERALELIEAENALPEKEKESNQPNLLGLTLPGTTADPPAPKAKGGLKDVGYFLLRKRSLVFNRLPAGCLAAQYVSSDSAYRKYGRNSPFSQQYESNGLKATMQVDSNWSFTFPRDGSVTFTANHSHGWTGSHYFQGGGQLQLQFDLGAVPETAGQEPADWLPPQRKTAVTAVAAARAVSDPVERVPESQSRLKPGTSNTDLSPARDNSSQRTAESQSRLKPGTSNTDPSPVRDNSGQPTPESQSRLKPGPANTDPSPARSDRPRQRVPEESPSPRTPTSRDNPAPALSPAETNPETVVTTNVPPPGVDPPDQKEPDARAASQALARGNRLFQSGKVEEALKQYETALKLSPESPETLLGAGRSRNATGDVKGAIAAYDRLVRLKPDTPNVGAWLAESYLALGDRKNGRAWLDWELKRAPNSAWTNSLMGTLEIMEGKQQVAAKHFARANALDPNIGNQRYQNATFLASRGQHTRALWDFTAALQLNPRLFHNYYGLGVSYAALGENLNAIRQFNFYLQFDQKSEWATKARQEINRLSRLDERR